MEVRKFCKRLVFMLRQLVAAIVAGELNPTPNDFAGLQQWLEDLEKVPQVRDDATMLLGIVGVLRRRQEQNDVAADHEKTHAIEELHELMRRNKAEEDER